MARIDAGPSAIALTPRTDFSGEINGTRLEKKDGRLILREALDDPAARLDRVSTLLGELAAEDHDP